MSKFNKQLQDKIDSKREVGLNPAKRTTVKPNTTNISGHDAYKMDKWFKLLSMLNTLKLESQYYKSENQQINDLKKLIHECAIEDVYLTAQCIVYSRCVADGMRSVSHVAATFLAPYISGIDWAKHFYGPWNKREQRGGVIYRTDDMSEIMSFYKLNNDKSLPAAMKKGFAKTIEGLDLYNFGKYTKVIRDVANMVHPRPEYTPFVDVGDVDPVPALSVIMNGFNIPANTWEHAQSEAGQIIAQAKREGKITNNEAKELLQEAKAENWRELLESGKLGILAALRNLRNILANNPSRDTIDQLCNLLTDPKKISQGKIMPYQLDLASEVIQAEFNSMESRRIVAALEVAYNIAIPNLVELLPGKTLVIVDQSGSMYMGSGRIDINRTKYNKFSGDKAALIAATIAKATNADIIRFGAQAEMVHYDIRNNINTISQSIKARMGSTNLEAAWRLAARSNVNYDRVFILSDNECNKGSSYAGYQQYLNNVGNPYVYSCDMAAYGTTQMVGPKVSYLYGYGTHLFEQISNVEYDPKAIWEQVKNIRIY